MEVSSAYLSIELFVKQLRLESVLIVKRVGAKTVLWGAPVLMVATDEIICLSLWFIKTNCGLLY